MLWPVAPAWPWEGGRRGLGVNGRVPSVGGNGHGSVGSVRVAENEPLDTHDTHSTCPPKHTHAQHTRTPRYPRGVPHRAHHTQCTTHKNAHSTLHTTSHGDTHHAHTAHSAPHTTHPYCATHEVPHTDMHDIPYRHAHTHISHMQRVTRNTAHDTPCTTRRHSTLHTHETQARQALQT